MSRNDTCYGNRRPLYVNLLRIQLFVGQEENPIDVLVILSSLSCLRAMPSRINQRLKLIEIVSSGYSSRYVHKQFAVKRSSAPL